MLENVDEFFNYMNTGDKTGNTKERSDIGIKRWEYFGHGNADQVPSKLHVESNEDITKNDIQRFDPNAFTDDPYFKSWGCNTAYDEDNWLSKYNDHIEGKAVGADNYTGYFDVYKPWYNILGSTKLPYVLNDGEWVEYDGEGNCTKFNELGNRFHTCDSSWQ